MKIKTAPLFFALDSCPLRRLAPIPLVLAFASIFFAAKSSAAPAVPPAGGETVMMPDFVISEDREKTKWRYIGHRDFEILSNSDSMAQAFANELPVVLKVADLLVPLRVRLRLNTPMMVVLEERYPRADLLLNKVTPAHLGSSAAYFQQFGDQDSFVGCLSKTIRQAGVIYPNNDNHVGRLGCNLFVVRMLSTAGLKPPGWLLTSVATAFDALDVRVAQNELRTNAWRLGGETRIPSLIPLQQAIQNLETPVRSSPALMRDYQLAQNTGRILVQWALLAEDGKYRERFWEFYVRSTSTAHPDEALFRECMQLSYAEALGSMETFYAKMRNGLSLNLKKTFAISFPSPAAPIRDATPAEIARITGEFSRMAAAPGSVKSQTTSQFLAAAGKIFERGLGQTTPPDPKLSASAGIFLAQLGRDTAALPYLEQATIAGVARPHAYLELARIRLATARAQPGSATGKLSAEQHRAVLEPLNQAYAQSTQQEQYYELLESLWENASVKPELADLAPLRELPKIFPRASALILRVAQLHAAHGFNAEARALCTSGLVFASDETTLVALTSLNQGLIP